MDRPTQYWTVLVTNAIGTTAEIDFGSLMSAAKIYIPAGYLSTALAFYTRDPVTQVYYQEKLQGATTNLSIPILANGAYPLPDQLFACTHLKIVSNNAGDNAVPVHIVSKA